MALCELSFSSPPPDAATLSVRHFEVFEALSTLFEVALVVRSPSAAIDLEGLVAQDASFSLHGGDLGRRTWSGVVFGAELLDVEEAGLSTYRVTLVPRAWLLTQRTNHRVFQHQSAPEIAAALFDEWGIEHALRLDAARSPKLEYRVQFGETDFAFVSRILEEAGVHYFFEEGGGGALLVLSDAPEAAAPEEAPIPWVDNPNAEARRPYVTGLAFAIDTRPGTITLRDHDLRRPEYPIVYRSQSAGPGEMPLEIYRYTPGAGRVDLASPQKTTETPVADDRSTARVEESAGHALAERRLSGQRADRRHVTFSTNVVRLAPGKALSIRNHPKPAFAPDRRMIVASARLEGTVDGAWDLSATALFADQPVRPLHKTPRPIVPGPESAVVVGPAGAEIHTDEFGRVRVRFHWDRGGAFDDQRTCWLRVAEGWAGAGWGMIATPRVGHEVIVDFQEGNPDEPLVVGRLYDATNPTPYTLPGKRTRSAWRTRSTPEGDGYNELALEDDAGHELLSLRAERDLHKVVLNEERESALRDRTVVVARDLIANAKQDDTLLAGAVHVVQMAAVTNTQAVADGGLPDVAPRATLREMIPGRITLTTGGATIQLDGPDVVITAQDNVRFKAGKEVIIWGGPYVQINPPLVGKQGDAEKAPPPPEQVVWFKLVSKQGTPLPDVVCHIEHPDGSASSAQRTDGHGLVRFAAEKEGDYKLAVGAPAPTKAKSDAASAPAPAPEAASTSAALSTPAADSAPAAEGARKPIDVGKTPAQKSFRARPTQHAADISIEIVSPQPQTAFEIDPGKHPTPDPSMPVVPLEARVLLQGQPVPTGTLTWELSISGQYRVRDAEASGGYRQQEYKFSAGNVTTAPGEKVDFQLAPGELVGGALEVKVTFEGGHDLGDLKASASVEALKVVGKNPAREDVEARVAELAGDETWCMLRMFCHESAHSLGQFRRGDVLYGPPSGVGIVQRDPEKDEWRWPADRITQPNNFFPRIFWNWKENVREGVDRFRSDYKERGRREIAALRRANPGLPEASDGVILRSAIRHYNGGNEYQVSADGAHYEVNPYLRRRQGSIVALPAGRLPYVNEVLNDPHVDAEKYPIPADVTAESWPADEPQPE